MQASLTGRSISAASALVAWTSVLAWLAGVVLGDRFWWSQWLSWIPALTVALASGGATLLAVALRPRWWRGRTVALAFVAVLSAMWAVRGNLGLGLAVPTPPTAVSVLQWNTDWPSGDDPRSERALAEQTADFTLISNRGSITAIDRVSSWAGPDARVYGAGPFALVTRWMVLEATPIASGGAGRQQWWVARFTVAPPGWQGRPLRIAMVDLPSRPTLSRAVMADALRKACEQGGLGEVDLVAGDFNATESSVILSRCFPDMHDVLSMSGRGWLATWPRVMPMWRIDHVLVGPRLRAIDGWTVNPGVSEHRMTMAVIDERG